ncbi:putative holin [Cupriavidus plantarum]|uniref:putative holin n=1 Tax=Cupriavidus plantarum TaxID=942865 RepID=UPI000E259340|nr:putative holin [Cupriavidus plantarum]REE92646.1 putative phage holin [Cupriavidus plantarum]
MAEPISASTTAAVAVTSVGAISLLPGVDAATVLGAFAGAAVFALTSDELSAIKKLAFLCLSILMGWLAAPLAASLIARALPADTEVSHGVGALVASAVLVKLLISLIRLVDKDGLVALLGRFGSGGGK